MDAVIQPSRKENESSAMTQMVDRYRGDKKTIFIADRGCFFAEQKQKLWECPKKT